MEQEAKSYDREEKRRNMPELRIGSSTMHVDFGEIDGEYAEKARVELRETPEVVEQAFKDIRTLLAGEPELIVPDEDEFYVKFLRPCKWYAKSAFELMKRFYQFRVNHPRLCDDLLPSKERNVLVSDVFLPMPDRTKDGCRVLLIQAGKKWNPKKVTTDELFKAAMLSLGAAMAEPKTQVAGVHVVLDMHGFSLSQVTYFTPSFAGMVTDWLQRCVPCRLKGIHVMNQPFVFNMVFALFKPFLQEKTRKRIHFHGSNKDSLTAHIGGHVMPTTLGGELILPDEPIGETVWKHFCWFEEEFEEGNRYGYTGAAKRT